MAHPYYGTTFGVPRTLHTERHVHGTPILCTWHTHIVAQLTHRSDAPFRRPVQTPLHALHRT